jgi:hypothetical protein
MDYINKIDAKCSPMRKLMALIDAARTPHATPN